MHPAAYSPQRRFGRLNRQITGAGVSGGNNPFSHRSDAAEISFGQNFVPRLLAVRIRYNPHIRSINAQSGQT
jgi:hypothetical protein